MAWFERKSQARQLDREGDEDATSSFGVRTSWTPHAAAVARVLCPSELRCKGNCAENDFESNAFEPKAGGGGGTSVELATTLQK